MKSIDMNSNFRIRIIIIGLFLIYTSCTAIMVRIDLIPLDMFALEIVETLFIFIIIVVFLQQIESSQKRSKNK